MSYRAAISSPTPVDTDAHIETRIPRPLNCFMLFRLEKQREIAKRCPGANHRDISKITSKWWKELSKEDKLPYVLESKRLKDIHQRMYPGYKFRPRKRTTEKRAYKTQRSQPDGFVAVGFENRRKLLAIYRGEGREYDAYNSPASVDGISSLASDSTLGTDKKNNLDIEQRPSKFISNSPTVTKNKRSFPVKRSKSVDSMPHKTMIGEDRNKKSVRSRTISVETVSIRSTSPKLAAQPSPRQMSPTSLQTYVPTTTAPASSSFLNGHYVVVSDLPPPPCHIYSFPMSTVVPTAADGSCVNYNLSRSYYNPEVYPYIVSGSTTAILQHYPPYPPAANTYFGYYPSYPYSYGQHYS
ncbi:hypothetical protein BDF20DRAFT_985651 [Mycotypha africana]|uniref:uncharacterized protein n=1 Tax=Mycotypha africana TaxID=64632 RepID=UPI002300A95C|nr:uncharacterized protein BDF20DRAFT_985651 [Mycotypha africana]KAI8988327.1 hypothetical protein BDF20DRAFT_985651 [Mycotypha africana]